MGNKSTRAATPAEILLAKVLSRESGLKKYLFDLSSIGHHGVPSNTKAIAFCGLQGILAIGTASGAIKLYGKDSLEVLIPPPFSKEEQRTITAGISKMKFTATQKLVVGFTDSSVRVYDLNTTQIVSEIPGSWTTNVLSCIETVGNFNYPYFFLATDDGNLNIIHEKTGFFSKYVITPRDVGLVTTEENKSTQFITAMASNPMDPNQILLAYEASSSVFLWDFAKHKVIREYDISKSRSNNSTSVEAESDGDISNSVQSLAWHASGKRFVAGYKLGAIGFFRIDKPNGRYHYVPETTAASTSEDGQQQDKRRLPVTQIQWIGAPTSTFTSKQAAYPFSGAIVFTGGCTIDVKDQLTVLYPPKHLAIEGEEVALTEIFKSHGPFQWSVGTMSSLNGGEITQFTVVKHDQINFQSKNAPFSLIVLSGNPLDGCFPRISVQCLPIVRATLFPATKHHDADAGSMYTFDWVLNEQEGTLDFPEPIPLPPLLQLNAISSCSIVNIPNADGSFEEDLYSTWEHQKEIDPMFRVCLNNNTKVRYEWPIDGGQVVKPLVGQFVSADSLPVGKSGTILLTGHANGTILFWEMLGPAELATSKGTITLIHSIDVASKMDPVPSTPEVTSISFCHDSRTLIVGFVGGEIAVLQFAAEGSSVGFQLVFSLHIHSEAITSITFSSGYGYAACTDLSGVVSLIELSTQSFNLLMSLVEEIIPVQSLLMSELVQTVTVPPILEPSSAAPIGGRPSLLAAAVGVASGTGSPTAVSQQPPAPLPTISTIEPVLFVGRADGRMEMYHLRTATKIADHFMCEDPKATAVPSGSSSSLGVAGVSVILMLDTAGKNVTIPGKKWKEDPSSATNTKPQEELQNQGAQLEITTEENKEELEKMQQLLEQVIHEDAEALAQETDGAVASTITPSPAPTTAKIPSKSEWNQENRIEAKVSPGSLGIVLFHNIDQHVVVKGFVQPANENTELLQSKGIQPGHVLVSINGFNVTSYSRVIVCGLLAKLADQEKKLVFAKGFLREESSNDSTIQEDPIAQLEKNARFLIYCVGKSVQLVLATFPSAHEMASSQHQQKRLNPSTILANATLKAPILSANIVCVPIKDRVENCLVLVDQSNRVTCLTLLGLELLFSQELSFSSSFLDGIKFHVTSNGEFMVLRQMTGEIQRFSLFEDTVANENALLQRKTIKTKLFQPDRVLFGPSSNSTVGTTEDSGTNGNSPSKTKKKSFSMFKKLMGISKEQVDLHQIFTFSTEEQERKLLMGDRTKADITTGDQAEGAAKEKKLNNNLANTKDILQQAGQRLQERGDKLNDLALKTEQMKQTSEDFYQTMKNFNEKQANKKWYEF